MRGKEVMRDVIYVREEKGRVLLRDVLGETRVIKGVKIVEVNVSDTKLLLERV